MYKVSQKKVKQLFKLKNKNPHPLCVIYEGTCACNETYISDTKTYARIKWDEHEDPRKESEPAKRLRSHSLAMPFPGKFYCLPQLIITSEKS